MGARHYAARRHHHASKTTHVEPVPPRHRRRGRARRRPDGARAHRISLSRASRPSRAATIDRIARKKINPTADRDAPTDDDALALASQTTCRAYGAAGFLNKDEVTDRVVSVVKNFAKVDAGKVTPTSAFASDLGLDSLDTVEVVMAMEEEFAVEIPDAEADKIQSIPEAVSYLASNPNAK
jgi:NADH dehydrogenase (ubiquinone) 1 alpha/beta subcomplex 1